MNIAAIPLALYIHIPWCVRKCPYCDFNSHPVRGELPERDYIDALLGDLAADAKLLESVRPLHSVFIGGGTPSLFSSDALHRLLQGIAAILPVPADTEITLEANPGTVDSARFADFRAAGVTRLSLGIQSFADNALRALGRIHDSDDARRAVAAAQTAGFTEFNLDLMFGLPGQSLDGALHDLETALFFGPPHLSWYQLTLEPHTAFFHAPPSALPDDDALWEMQEAGQAYLAARGYGQYEVSAYALAQRRCAHNLNYWHFGDYLGVGAGAHGKVTRRDGVFRYAKPAHPREYLNAFAAPGYRHELRPLNEADRLLEFMLNALRLREGFALKMFEAHTGLQSGILEAALQQAEAVGWLTRDADWIRPTDTGMRFLNNLLELFCQ